MHFVRSAAHSVRLTAPVVEQFTTRVAMLFAVVQFILSERAPCTQQTASEGARPHPLSCASASQVTMRRSLHQTAPLSHTQISPLLPSTHTHIRTRGQDTSDSPTLRPPQSRNPMRMSQSQPCRLSFGVGTSWHLRNPSLLTLAILVSVRSSLPHHLPTQLCARVRRVHQRRRRLRP